MLNNHVRNPQLITKKSNVSTDDLIDAAATEVVEYVVIQRPFLKFDDGSLQQFSLDLKVRANTAAFPRTDDTFSKSLIEMSQ